MQTAVVSKTSVVSYGAEPVMLQYQLARKIVPIDGGKTVYAGDQLLSKLDLRLAS